MTAAPFSPLLPSPQSHTLHACIIKATALPYLSPVPTPPSLDLRPYTSISNIIMEEGKGSSSSSSSPSSSRWNPTKEQITILEGLYKQGIRTPSAEQIQQITGKLREYGSIEGKNVFYWFQNHKARQRQKQKQESFAYFSRLLNYAQPSPPMPHPATVPLPPAACANVVCNPYYVPAQQATSVIDFHQPTQFPNVFLQAGALSTSTPHINFQRNVTSLKESNSVKVPPAGYDISDQAADMACQIEFGTTKNDGSFGSETLQLFPLHPTGILQEERSGSSRMSPSVGSAGSLEDEQEEMIGTENQSTFDFLPVHGRKI